MTLRFALLGHPVAHSVSPAIHAAAYRELGLPHRYELVDCPDEASVAVALERLRSGELAGANVTVPWKRVALRLAERTDPSAERVGAANVLVVGAGSTLTAHNTDVPALTEELRRLVAAPPRALLLGGGGAALAAVAAVAAFGVGEIAVSARRFSDAEPRAAWPAARELVSLGARLVPWPASSAAARREFEELAASSGLFVQCTSAGMHGADTGDELAALVPWARLPAGALAYDLVYNPAETPFLRAARAAGHRAENGLGMLVGQAALAIRLWLGAAPPREPLLRAAERALRERGRP